MGVHVSQLEEGQQSPFWSGFSGEVALSSQASILRRVSHGALWENFLSSTATSFAVTLSDLGTLLRQSLVSKENSDEENASVKAYVDLIRDLSEQGDLLQAVDFMAVCSSALLLSSTSLKDKIDTLFSWMDMDMAGSISMEQFYISNVSFERGLSYSTGTKPCSEEYLLGVSKQWFSVIGSGRENETVKGKIGKEKFTDFCTNRHYAVRVLLEAFSVAPFPEVAVGEKLSQLVPTVSDHESKAGVMKGPGGGDEWLANPAWIKTAEKMVPKSCVPNPDAPDVNFQLEWVHGYRGFDSRNNLRYVTASGSAVAFNAAGLGVVQVQNDGVGNGSSDQLFFAEHTDDVICLAFSEPAQNGNWEQSLVATGEIGKNAAIHLWRAVPHMQSLACLTGCHPKGVSHLVFSKDGSKLFSVGVEYTVAVHCVKEGDKQFGKLVSSAQGPKGMAMHACLFGPEGAELHFVTCGEKHVVVWTVKGSSLKMETVKLKTFKNNIFLAGARFGAKGSLMIGTADGDMLILDGADKSISQWDDGSEPAPARKGEKAGGKKGGRVSVAACWATPAGDAVVTGDSQGLLRVLRAGGGGVLTQSCSVTMAYGEAGGEAGRPASIRSVCLSADGAKALVGTQRCEVVEVALPAGEGAHTVTLMADDAPPPKPQPAHAVLNRGHYRDELWGLSVNPSPAPASGNGPASGDYCTVGDDHFLRVWSYAARRQLRSLDMGTMARTCAYSHDGTMIAVGYGGRVGRGKQKQDGLIRVYKADDFSILFETRDATKWVSEIKFSKDGRFLAVGTHDNSIYMYSVPQQFKRKFKFTKHNSYITHFDFSADGSVLQSNCGAYELLFCDTAKGAHIMKGSTLSETDWATYTCPLGWPALGVWPAGADGTDINGVDRSPSGALIATADDFGKLKMFRYPCVVDKSKFVEFSGHSSHVTNVRWGPTDAWLVTTGGNDKCVFQWRNHNLGSMDGASGKRARHSREAAAATAAAEEQEEYLDDGPGGGDEFMAVRPYKGAIVAPSSAAHPDPTRVVQFKAALGEMSARACAVGEAPTDAHYAALAHSAEVVWDRLCDSGHADTSLPEQDELVLDHVYGYRGFDCRNNVFYVSGASATRSVVYPAAALGVVTSSQLPEKQRFLKGHSDDIVSMACSAVAPGGGETLVATGQMGPGSVHVWSMPSMACRATIPTKQKTVNGLAFSKDGRLLMSIAEDNSVCISEWASQRVVVTVAGEPAATHHIAASDDPTALFLSCGNKHIRVWSLAGRNLTSVKVPTSSHGGPQQFLSAAYLSGQWLVGCEDGNILVVDKNGKKVLKAFAHSEGGGGKKGKKGKGGGNNDSVTAMHVCDSLQLLFTGSKRGSVAVWTAELARMHTFDASSVMVNKIALTAGQIQAISCTVAQDAVYLALGTRGCDMIEVKVDLVAKTQELVDRSHGGLSVRGHCNNELWGLACHPTKPTFITVGDDKTLKKWSIHDKRLLLSAGLGAMARACCYDPAGKLIAVGMGGRVGTGKQKADGTVRVYDETTLEMRCEVRDAKQWIGDIKFSPDGLTLAAASHNNSILLYSVARSDSNVTLTLRGKFAKHNSYITHFDFSADSRFIQSNCGAYELLFSNASNGKQITSASELKDVKWASWTCTLGWPVQGIWPPAADGTDVNAVDRSHSGHLVATSDDFGKVSIFRYPCLEGAQPIVSSGHSSHVMNVRWSVGDQYLLSAGGNDKCVLQWRHSMVAGEGGGSAVGGGGAGPETATDSGGVDEDEDEDEGPGGGDEAGAVKPWLGAIRPPANPPTLSALAPTTALELSYVHGYTSANSGDGYRVSSNLFYNADGDIVYPAASLGVKLSVTKNSSSGVVTERAQQYFTGHDDDVLCLNISLDRRFVGTGQTASTASKGKASVCIWGASDCRLLCKLEKCHDRAVVSLAFSPDGTKLVTVGQDNSYTHTVWQDAGGGWSRVTQVASLKSDGKPVLFSRWISTAAGSENHFITGGGSSINFWKIEGAQLTRKPGKFNKQKQSPILSVANLCMKDKWRVICGISTGDLYSFEDRDCVSSVSAAHGGAVVCIQEGSADCQFLISGGTDKCVKVWNQALQPVSFFQLTQALLTSPVNATIGSIDIKFDSAKNLVLLCGTYGGEIIELSAGQSEHNTKQAGSLVGLADANFDLSTPSVDVLQHSHYSGELWGLAAHPTDPDCIATVGDDSTVRLWSISGKRMTACFLLQWPGRCIAWSPDGAVLAVGLHELTKGGRKAKKGKKKSNKSKSEPAAAGGAKSGCCVIIFVSVDQAGVPTMTEIARGGSSVAWISDIKFSPSGSWLAFGAHDQRLYMYDVPSSNDPDAWEKALSKTPFKPYDRHSSAITHFDFSEDEHYLQSNCQAYELLFMKLRGQEKKKMGTQEPSASKLADYNGKADPENPAKKWASWTCTLGWPVQGIWPPGADGTDINSADRSPLGSILATADDFGLVKLFRYPCATEKAEFAEFSGHSSHVTNVRFNASGEELLSVGGNDKCLFVWRMVNK
jgi:WD40 repeat protein